LQALLIHAMKLHHLGRLTFHQRLALSFAAQLGLAQDELALLTIERDQLS
jgi:hypothetical protein